MDKTEEVRYEDQQDICEFGRNTNHLQELRDDLKEDQKQLDLLEDAEQEVMLASDEMETYQIRMGSAFFQVDEEDFNEFIERRREKHSAQKEKLAVEIEKLQDRNAQLKTKLYARFGTNINLEAS